MLTTQQLLESLIAVRCSAIELEAQYRAELDLLSMSRRGSGENLLHYLAVRNVDLRNEQRSLARLGLSSLGRAEAHVVATLDAVIERLGRDVGRDLQTDVPDLHQRGPGPDRDERIDANATAVLGTNQPDIPTRIMVTLPSEAADDPTIADELVAAGMSIARINCAHDNADAWLRMAVHVRDAATRRNRDVKVSFDLAGPKLRTGELRPGVAVAKVKPERDELGRVVQPGLIRFVADHPTGSHDGIIELTAGSLVKAAAPDDEIHLRDARGRKRRFVVTHAVGPTIDAATERTAYLVGGTKLKLVRNRRTIATGSIADLPPTDGSIELASGATLELRRGNGQGQPAARVGTILHPAYVYVDLDELFDSVTEGQRVLLDDGLIEATVTKVGGDCITLTVVHPERARLKAEKGINLPDTDLRIPALTDADITALESVAPYADLVALSFVGSVDDIDFITSHIDRLRRTDLGVVLKIEHRAAFEALPELLLRALRHGPIAVMVARGDLAVEIGYERLAEVQEEILLLCEAAHVPVIWATQVLESLAKNGAPTRAEITDAASASRAECIMLNKGPFIADTIQSLANIVGRMRGHLDKRTPTLRRLAVAGPMATKSA